MASIPLAEAERGVGSRPAFALFVLFLVGALNILDRNILIILQEPIKADLGLSDTQLGSLTGLSFAIVYCLAGAPIARLADRTVRIRIIAISVAVWSALTATSGAAVNYAQLVLLRMGVATGEAGAFPATLSLLSDYFPLKKRPLAFALWAQCQPVGSALGLLVGGALAATAGWRNTLLIIGLVGIALAPCVMLLREPKRGRFDEGYVPAPPQPAGELVKSFFANKALAWLLAASAMQGFVLFSVQSWSAPLYARVFAVPTEELAFYLSGVIGVAGGVGILLGGVLGRLLVTRSPAWMQSWAQIPAPTSPPWMP